MKKATVNYWVDVIIGIAFVGSALSGLVFLLPGNPATGVLGLSYRVWNDLHTWSSLALIAGVGAHLLLHGSWIVAMTRRMLPFRQQARPASGAAPGPAMSRRAFLALGGATVAAVGLLGLAGSRIIADALAAQEGEGAGATTAPVGAVACPYGRINDPYPGQCRFYTDANGDGFCDYSVPGSEGTLPTPDLPAIGGEGGGRRRRGS